VGGLTLLDGSRLEGLLARARLKPRIAEPDPLAFGCAKAALVRSLIFCMGNESPWPDGLI